jgi:HEAT repeat protein
MTVTRQLLGLILVCALLGCQNQKGDVPPGPNFAPKYPKSVPTPIDPALQSLATDEIRSALAAKDQFIRAHALEIIAERQLAGWDTQVVGALNDPSSLVRKAAALTVGQLKIASAAGKLPDLLNREPGADPRLAVQARQERVAGIFALHQLGITTYSHDLEKLASDPSPYVRGDAAIVFGLIGDKSAIPWLQNMLHRDTEVNVRLQAAEALWRMGDELGEDALIQGTVSNFASDQAICALALAEPRDTQLLGNVEGLFNNDYLEVRLVAARAAGMLGSDIGYGIAMEGAKSVDPRQRSLSALAFADIGRSDSQKYLAKLLKDSDPDTRLAAAGALIAIAKQNAP